LIEEEERLWEEEMEAEADFMDSDIILDTFKEEFADVYNDPEELPKVKDYIDLRIAEGRNPNSWNLYEEAGLKFTERKQKVKENPELKLKFEREEQINSIRCKNLRATQIDNNYFNNSLDPSEPKTLEETAQKFQRQYFDVSGEESSLAAATKNVDKQHEESFIETGAVDNTYEVYDRAGETARVQKALKELKKARGQI